MLKQLKMKEGCFRESKPKYLVVMGKGRYKVNLNLYDQHKRKIGEMEYRPITGSSDYILDVPDLFTLAAVLEIQESGLFYSEGFQSNEDHIITSRT